MNKTYDVKNVEGLRAVVKNFKDKNHKFEKVYRPKT